MKIIYTKTENATPFIMDFENMHEAYELIEHINSMEFVKRKGYFQIDYDILTSDHHIYWVSKRSMNNYLPEILSCVIDLRATDNNVLSIYLRNFFLNFIYIITYRYRPPLIFNETEVKSLDLIKLYKLYKYFTKWDDEPFTREKYEAVINDNPNNCDAFIL